MKKFFEVNAIEAGAFDEEKGELTITVIQPGFNASKARYYPEDTLRRDHKIFEGAKMFLDHPTPTEEKARPEGSLRNLVGQIKTIWAETDGRIRAKCALFDESFRSTLRNMNSHGLLGSMGVSIRAAGEAREAVIQGIKTNLIERLSRSRSVDFVTFPGAGGHAEVMESDQYEEDTSMELADLTKQLTEANAKLAQTQAVIEAVLKENKELKTKVEESEKVAKVAKAKAEIDGKLSESELPEMAKKRIAARFEGAEASTGIVEAIAEEKAYLAEIQKQLKEADGKPKQKPTVTGLGESTTPDGKTVSRASIYRQLGLSEAAAKLADTCQ